MRASRAILAGAILASGCTFNVSLKTQIPARTGTEKIGGKVELVAPPLVAEQDYNATGMFWIGFGHTWKFRIGEEVVGSSEKIYQMFYEQVDVSQSRAAEDEGYLLVIVPEIEEFEVSSIGMRTEVVLRYQIADASGHLIRESSVEGASSFGGPQWVGVFLGVLGGKYALSDSASDALDEAYAKLVEDLENDFKAGLLVPSAVKATDPGSAAIRERPVSLP